MSESRSQSWFAGKGKRVETFVDVTNEWLTIKPEEN